MMLISPVSLNDIKKKCPFHSYAILLKFSKFGSSQIDFKFFSAYALNISPKSWLTNLHTVDFEIILAFVFLENMQGYCIYKRNGTNDHSLNAPSALIFGLKQSNNNLNQTN
ncbi:hypothetical protein BpHYR1_051855 [Brachionus plicatilis]|uniref:Uncharacterized protein n=1 Tax=Brachionus plicatilis TaxID=10195 RepID=A0A3M7SHN7_BRAPC|nr:hypothetical protein BpHYR1_051855 [Brachionus plicatilis]